MTIIGYARVSTRDQDHAAQVAELKAAGCAQVFAEQISGAWSNRPQLARALRNLDQGDVLIVTRLDRLARSTRDLLNVLAHVADRGAGFRSLRDAWADTTTPHGRLMLTVLGGLAEFERELIAERKRINPNQQSTTPHKFAPSDEDKSNWLKKLDIRTVFDVGANVGQFAGEIHAILPSAAIYSFEPLRDCYTQLVDTMKDVRSFRAFDFALGDETSQTTIHRSRFSPSSSLLAMGDVHKQAFPFTNEGWVSESTRIRRLDVVADELNLVDNILIKIDVQGFEDRVIRGGWNTVRRAKLLIVEVSFEISTKASPCSMKSMIPCERRASRIVEQPTSS